MSRGMLRQYHDETTMIPLQAKEAKEKRLSICIVGSGTVGKSVGRGFLRLGSRVIFHDVDCGRVDDLTSLGLDATDDLGTAIQDAQITFICVPTPMANGSIDLSYVESAATEIGKSLRNRADSHLVVVKSTVLPTTTENTVIPILERHSKRRAGEDFGVCVNPAFLTEIHRSWTEDKIFARAFRSEPFVVIGELDKRSGDLLQATYEPLKAPIIRTDLRTAEMIKYACNCALACRISFWNEVFYICQRLDVNSMVVASIAAMDERIGRYGTIHGKAFGGKCLPKDLRAFIRFSREVGYEPDLLKAVEKINVRTKNEFGVRE